MSKGFNYSKWDKLELSDDEDSHPGAKFVEEQTLRRIKRESHKIKETERQEKIDKLQAEQQADDARYRELERQLGSLSSEETQSQEQLLAVQTAIDERSKQIEKLLREKKFNADELCHVAKEKTLVGSACKPDSNREVSFEDYVALHKATMEAYSASILPLADCRDFLTEHPELVHEHCMGYLLLRALDLGMAEKLRDMRRVVKQKYHIKCLLDFATARRANPQSCVKPFFARLMSEDNIAKDYDESFEELLQKLVARARQKRAEEEEAAATAEREERVLTREERLGPGGLDPLEVYEELPEALQAAYDSGDVARLREYMDTVPLEEARVIMSKMVASGLWVPSKDEDPGAALRAD